MSCTLAAHAHTPQGPSYEGYSLSQLPRSAYPQKDRQHKGKHSYTISRGGKLIECLLRNEAFYVRDGPNKGVSTAKIKTRAKSVG